MRWIKHLTLAHCDRAIDAATEEYGAEAYGVWWLILEDIAAPMEPGKMVPSATHSAVKWAQICRSSVRRFTSIAKTFADQGLIVMQSTDNRIQIDVPNLLKYRDEYSKKSGQTPAQSRSRADRKQKQSKLASKHSTPSAEEAPPAESSLAGSLAPSPLTTRAVRKCFPATDDKFIGRLVTAVEKEIAGLTGPVLEQLNDEMIGDAVLACHEPGQRSAGLFLQTVPRVVRTWLTDGRASHPTGAGQADRNQQRRENVNKIVKALSQ